MLMPNLGVSLSVLATKDSGMSHTALCKLIPCPLVLTCGGADGGRDGGGHGWDAVIVLRVAGLDGSQVAVTAGSEAAGQVQGLHGLRLHLAEHRLAHRLKLAVYFCFAHLRDTKANGHAVVPFFSQVGIFLCSSRQAN